MMIDLIITVLLESDILNSTLYICQSERPFLLLKGLSEGVFFKEISALEFLFQNYYQITKTLINSTAYSIVLTGHFLVA